MSYNNSSTQTASLVGPFIWLLVIVATATTVILSTGLGGSTDRRGTVVLPAIETARGEQPL
jgi:hypothetical protein